MSISFSLQKKEVDIMYHGIQKKIVTDEWLIKETKVKAQNKDYIYGYEYNGVFYQLDMFPENINQSLQELKDKGYKNIYYNKEFGKFKVIFDFTLVTVAIILSLIFTQRIEGVREGSLIAACITGYIVSFLNNKIMTRKMLSRVSSISSNLAFNTNINCIHSPQTAFKFKSNDVGFRNIGQCIITNMKKILLAATKVFDKTISF